MVTFENLKNTGLDGLLITVGVMNSNGSGVFSQVSILKSFKILANKSFAS